VLVRGRVLHVGREDKERRMFTGQEM